MWKRIITTVSALLLVAGYFGTADAQIPQKAETGKFAITNATVHTVANGTIENGVVLIEGEMITFVGKDTPIGSDFERIDASGKHVYPGFMDSGTILGLQEVGAVSVTNDQAELGSFNPHVRAFTAINPSSAAIPVTRVNGVTHVLSAPVSGRISGKAILMDLYGYTPDSMAVRQNAALRLSWPTAQKRGFFDRRSEKEIKKQYKENIKELNDYWEKAEFYHKMMNAYAEDPGDNRKPDTDKEMEAMREVVSGDIPVVINVDREKDILNALDWIAGHDDERFILSGVKEGWRVADSIAVAGVPVILSTLYTPVRDYDNYQRPYQNPGLLHEAGVKVAIMTNDDQDPSINVRNVPYHAGYAATYGLGREEAIKALTINPAEIFGVADRLGSLEAGKQANLFISDGDPLEPMSHIEQVFIRGNKIPMVSRHTQLYQEFLNRGAVKN